MRTWSNGIKHMTCAQLKWVASSARRLRRPRNRSYRHKPSSHGDQGFSAISAGRGVLSFLSRGASAFPQELARLGGHGAMQS